MAGEGPAIGIDLRTAYSCAVVYRNGNVEIIPDAEGNRTIPSCVAFTEMERLVGSSARSQAHMNPTNTIYKNLFVSDVKKIIGRRFGDDSVQKASKLLPFGVSAGPNDRPMASIHYKGEEKLLAPQEIAAMVLSRTKEMAEAYLGTKIRNAVVSIPAHFNHSQRQATRDACTIAGLNVMRLISDSTATALCYSIKRNCSAEAGKRNVLVFDIGASILDVTVVVIEEEVIEVKATRGDGNLGGDDFDERMVVHFLQEFRRKRGVGVSSNTRALSKLRTACEGAKRMLSTHAQAIVKIDSFIEGIDFSSRITQSKFEVLNMDLFERCIRLTRNCLTEARMDVGSINVVVLVGSSTRIPRIQQLLGDLFNARKLCTAINPDEAVAYGAAVQATILGGDESERIQRSLVLDVTPWSLRKENHGRVMKFMIPKNTRIPTRKQQVFSTHLDNQTCFPVRVYEGEKVRTPGNNFLGRLELSGIHPAPRGVPLITVCFDLDANQLLVVSVVDETTGLRNILSISSGMLGKEEIRQMTARIERYRAEDEEHKIQAECRYTLEEYIFHIRDEIQQENIRSRLRHDQKKKIEDAIDLTFCWLDDHQLTRPDAIWQKMMDLANVWIPIVTEISSRDIQPSVEASSEDRDIDECVSELVRLVPDLSDHEFSLLKTRFTESGFRSVFRVVKKHPGQIRGWIASQYGRGA